MSFPGLVVGAFIGVILVIIVATQIATGGVLKKTSEKGDVSDVGELAEAMRSKCEAVRKETAAPVAIGVDTSFEEVDTLDLSGSGTSYSLKVSLEGGGAESFELQGCRYELKPGSAKWNGDWSFKVSNEEGTSRPPVIRAEGSRK